MLLILAVTPLDLKGTQAFRNQRLRIISLSPSKELKVILDSHKGLGLFSIRDLEILLRVNRKCFTLDSSAQLVEPVSNRSL